MFIVFTCFLITFLSFIYRGGVTSSSTDHTFFISHISWILWLSSVPPRSSFFTGLWGFLFLGLQHDPQDFLFCLLLLYVFISDWLSCPHSSLEQSHQYFHLQHLSEPHILMWSIPPDISTSCALFMSNSIQPNLNVVFPLNLPFPD